MAEPVAHGWLRLSVEDPRVLLHVRFRPFQSESRPAANGQPQPKPNSEGARLFQTVLRAINGSTMWNGIRTSAAPIVTTWM